MCPLNGKDQITFSAGYLFNQEAREDTTGAQVTPAAK